MFSATATNGTGLPGRFGADYAFINKVCPLLSYMHYVGGTDELLARPLSMSLSTRRRSTFSVSPSSWYAPLSTLIPELNLSHGCIGANGSN